MSVATTGLDFHHSNIKNFDDVMPVSACMKRKSEERLDAVIRRLGEEEEMNEAAVAAAVQWKEMKEAAVAAVVTEEAALAAAAAAERDRKRAKKEAEEAAVAAVAAVKMKVFVEFARSQPSCVRLCSHVGCVKSVHVRGVCNFHGPRCSHVGCIRSVYVTLHPSWPEVQPLGMHQVGHR